MAEPAAERLELDRAMLGDASHEEADLVEVTSNHDARSCFIAADNPEEAAEPVLYELIGIFG
ncbi:hypothetical protein D3C71_1966780 [compost metagenome]